MDKGHCDEVTGCCFVPGGLAVVTSFEDITLKVWDIDSGSLIRTLGRMATSEWCTDYAMHVEISPDGANVLSGRRGFRKGSSLNGDPNARLWKFSTGEIEHSIRVPGGVDGCSFSPNETLFLLCSDSFLKLYDSKTYQLQRPFSGHVTTYRYDI